MADSQTSWIAIYAAIVATAALLLNFRSWYEKRVRLKLSLMPDAMIMGGFQERDEKGLMALNVVNRGGQSTTLMHLVVLGFTIGGSGCELSRRGALSFRTPRLEERASYLTNSSLGKNGPESPESVST
jgi:hypothetical protein